MSLRSQYMGQDTRGLSGRIWDRIDVDRLMRNPREGHFFYDDFLNTPTFASATSQSGYITYQDTSATVAGVATDDADCFLINSTATTDNNEAGLTFSANVGAPFRLDTSVKADVAFEARIKLSSVTDVGFIVGLAEEGLAAANTLTDNTGAPADKDYIGYRILTADSDGLDAVYNMESAGGETVAKNEAQVISTGTWYKVGFRYDSQRDKLVWYVDNDLIATTSDVSALTSGSFPDGEALAPLIHIKTGSAADKEAALDWWAIGQYKAS